jgi:DNA-binding NarL/FixJ family response regulator
MDADKRIRIMIIEDQVVFRLGLAAIINTQSNMKTVAETDNCQEAIRLLAERRPDVILVDLGLSGLGGVSAIASIIQRAPWAKIVALSSYEDTEQIVKAVRAGARGYFLRDVKGRDLIEAINDLCSDRPTESAEICSSRLPSREIEILKLLGQGRSNSKIALFRFHVETRQTPETDGSRILGSPKDRNS